MIELRTLENLFEKAMSEKALAIEHMTFGHNSVTFDVTAASGSYILRSNSNPSVFEKTSHNLQVLASLGLPVSKPLLQDLSLSAYPFAYMILKKIPGRDLRYELPSMSRSQMSVLAERIVEFQRLARSLPKKGGFGWVAIGEAGTHETWRGCLGIDDLPGKCAGEGGLEGLAVEVAEAFELRSDYLESILPVSFLDDITTKNVIIENGALTGLIDFDCICYGDPLHWLALTETAIVCDVGAPGRFYFEELKRFWGLSALEESVVSLYSSLIGLDFHRNCVLSGDFENSERMKSHVVESLAKSR